ncbi:unnamed protein product [Hydatigera taeniaeformis]|uniref:RRM domain-containing protein n=1 Tax=Hydatigena taeniaeformis TaxID=6205 RepID=A0A158RDS5_HYDTA|nr:unnamed protein product [Hydatigera taeniaeformis]
MSKIANKGGLNTTPPKSNEELRGLTKSVLLKGLPANARYVLFKKSLPLTPKSLTLSTRFGLKNALLTFSTEEDCSKAFNALQSYTYGGQKPLVVFVRPRATVSRVAPVKLASIEFCLDVTNIPFSTTLDRLKTIFPRAETILMRCRRDGKFKGSCIAVFRSQSDFDEAEAVCRDETIEGRRLLCSRATPGDYDKLLQELTPGLSKRDREGLQIKLFNLPYGVKEEEIKKTFPKARNIFLPHDKEGKPTGIAILTFKTKVICQAALARARNLKFQGRRLRAEINGEKGFHMSALDLSVPKKGKKDHLGEKKSRSSKSQSTRLRRGGARNVQSVEKPRLNLSEALPTSPTGGEGERGALVYNSEVDSSATECPVPIVSV